MIFITTLGACLGAKNCFCENTEFDLTHPSGLRSPVTSTNGEIVMAPRKAPTVPKAPPAVPTPVETVEMPNTILVQHNVTKKQFRVSKRYFETYSSVLTRVD